MNITITPNRTNPQFGRFTILPSAEHYLQAELDGPAEQKMLQSLISSQESNPVNIHLYASKRGTKLKGQLSDRLNIYSRISQNPFAAVFSSPLEFIKKLCKNADLLHKLHYRQ